jgi:chromosome partitioning protein
LSFLGQRTLLIDSDVQGSARDWSASGNKSGLSVVGLDRPTLEKDVPGIAQDYCWVVIDGASKLEKMIASAVKVADLILIPIQPSPLDLWACDALIEVIQARQSVTNGIPSAAFVITRAKKGTVLTREIRGAIVSYGFPLLHGCLHDRTVFARSLANGSTALEDDPNGQAAFEIKHLLKQVVEAFNA